MCCGDITKLRAQNGAGNMLGGAGGEGGGAADNPLRPADEVVRSKLRKEIVTQRRTAARVHQQQVLNNKVEYDPDADVETEEEDLPDVIIESDQEVTLDLIRGMLSGAKDRFDKACKYHPGNEGADKEKFETWLRRAKTAFRRTAYLCRAHVAKMDRRDPARLQFVEKQVRASERASERACVASGERQEAGCAVGMGGS